MGALARAGRTRRRGGVAGVGLAGALAVARERALDGGGEEAGAGGSAASGIPGGRFRVWVT